MVGRRLERKGINRVVVAAEADLEVATSEQRRQLPVAVPEIQDHREGVVLLGMRREEVDEEALAAACRSEHERVSDVFDV